MLPEPGDEFPMIVQGISTIRKLVLRYLMLPRPEFTRKKYISREPEKNGKYSTIGYVSYPWYVVPTFGKRKTAKY
jgi:hypothetical protein